MKLKILTLAFLLLTSPVYGAWQFNAANEEVEMADNAALNLPDADWTICGYFKLNSNTGTGFQNLFGWGVQSGAPSINIYIREASATSPNAMTVNVRDAANDAVVPIVGTPGTSTAWQRFCVTRTGAGVLTVYIDGASIGSGNNAATDDVDVAGSAWFGVDGDGSGEIINDGLLTDWGKWDRGLSAAELASLNKFSVDCVGGHKWFVPMIREYQEIANGLTLTNANTTYADGPPLIYCH